MSDIAQDSPILSAWRLSGNGGGVELDATAPASWNDDGRGVLWLHLNRAATGTREYLKSDLNLADAVVEALMAPESRPRLMRHDDGLLINLRGVNLSAGADPEDMVGLRIWLERDRIVTLRLRKVYSIDDIRAALAAGHGPHDPGGFLVMLAGRLVERMTPVIVGLGDAVDAIEDDLAEGMRPEHPKLLAELRRRVVRLHRYLSPQRDALLALGGLSSGWFGADNLVATREIADRALRLVEELDATRERAAVTHDEIAAQQAERMGRNTYVLSVVAAIALPLSLVSGLLGMNVGGIPLTESPFGFAVVTGGLTATALVGLWLLRRVGWL